MSVTTTTAYKFSNKEQCASFMCFHRALYNALASEGRVEEICVASKDGDTVHFLPSRTFTHDVMKKIQEWFVMFGLTWEGWVEQTRYLLQDGKLQEYFQKHPKPSASAGEYLLDEQKLWMLSAERLLDSAIEDVKKDQKEKKVSKHNVNLGLL